MRTALTTLFLLLAATQTARAVENHPNVTPGEGVLITRSDDSQMTGTVVESDGELVVDRDGDGSRLALSWNDVRDLHVFRSAPKNRSASLWVRTEAGIGGRRAGALYGIEAGVPIGRYAVSVRRTWYDDFAGQFFSETTLHNQSTALLGSRSFGTDRAQIQLSAGPALIRTQAYHSDLIDHAVLVYRADGYRDAPGIAAGASLLLHPSPWIGIGASVNADVTAKERMGGVSLLTLQVAIPRP